MNQKHLQIMGISQLCRYMNCKSCKKIDCKHFCHKEIKMKIINHEPAKSVTKEQICPICGVTLEYVPNDIKVTINKDYTGCSERTEWIECLNCQHRIILWSC